MSKNSTKINFRTWVIYLTEEWEQKHGELTKEQRMELYKIASQLCLADAVAEINETGIVFLSGDNR